jgi:AmiR/NasT family two-component response regulator
MSERVLTAINAEYIKIRLHAVLKKRNLEIVELSKYQSIFSNINFNVSDDLEILIIDQSLDFEMQKLMDEISKIRKNLPVVLLSNPLRKDQIVKYLKMGISDFIILPMDEKRINKTLDKFLHASKNLVEINNINNHYKDILALELKKSNKGNYPIVFSLMIFDELNGYQHAEKFLKEIVDDLWDTDQIMFFRKNVLLGIHPFSCHQTTDIIKDKFLERYSEFKSKNRMIKQSITIETVVKGDKKENDVNALIKTFKKYL